MQFKPPLSVRLNAIKALNRRADLPASYKGLTATGHRRAKQLADKESMLTIKDLKNMRAWFARHYHTSFLSPHYSKRQRAWIAWHAWGGTEGREWVENTLQNIEQNAIQTKKRSNKAKA